MEEELVSIVQGCACPWGKGRVSDEICTKCRRFEGYVDAEKSNGRGLMLEFTKDKSRGRNIDGIYFYICKHKMKTIF